MLRLYHLRQTLPFYATFCVDVSQEELGAKRVVPLKADGENIDVTNENLGECKYSKKMHVLEDSSSMLA